MGRIYTASFEAIPVSVIQDLFEINAPSDACVAIHSAELGQTSDAGDAQAELLRVAWSRAPTASGSGGASVTPAAHEEGTAAFGGTVERNNTTQATGTTVVVPGVFNVQGGYFYQPMIWERIVISPGGRLVLELPAAPADSLTMTGRVTFEEYGG